MILSYNLGSLIACLFIPFREDEIPMLPDSPSEWSEGLAADITPGIMYGWKRDEQSSPTF